MVLENLINNSIKYSNKNDEVKIVVEENDKTIEISIYDRGIGIPNNEKDIVFDRFYRGKKVESNGIKGYGLGLNLVKIVITKMGGKISIEDNLPKGTIFKLTIPKLILE